MDHLAKELTVVDCCCAESLLLLWPLLCTDDDDDDFEIEGDEMEEDIMGSLLEDTISSLFRDEPASDCIGDFGCCCCWLIGIRLARLTAILVSGCCCSVPSQFSCLLLLLFLSDLDGTLLWTVDDMEFCLSELLTRMLSFLGLIGSSFSSAFTWRLFVIVKLNDLADGYGHSYLN